MLNAIYQVPAEIIEDIRRTNGLILEKLQTLQDSKDPERFLTRKEFMREARIGETLMTHLITKNLIKVSRRGRRTIRIPYSELLRFLKGEV